LSKIYGLNQFVILITSGIQISCTTVIGEEFHIIHSGNIIIHPDAVIGDRCGILNEVTIGTNMKPGCPVIGDDVFIGAGAKVLGHITVGDGARIAANSLVTIDVPPGATAIGVPAEIIMPDR
jgi:serine O-acetyltransferase